ncbi:alpha/beta fold hydrolase [Nocardia spumae]|uniref:alpha/beta fold hydrolase n=1 Tax=Nocardia spumae TaxID=2887190 RepID=UPI001D15AFA7|nr:alpha/beta hydrolase [Nocardia spumae]
MRIPGMKHAQRLRITTPDGIDEASFVRIGGIDQWISIRGEHRDNPVLLEIHGGPGASNLIYAARTRVWERHFTVVRWDMRGAGKTFGHTGPTGQGEMSLAQLERDGAEVTEYVRARLDVDKVVLVGCSFGSFVALRLARSHPEFFSAYVGTDQNINAGGRDRTAYAGLLDRLEKTGKRQDLAAVTAMTADRSAWTTADRSRFDKHAVGSDPLTLDTVKKVVMGSLLTSPLHSLAEVRTYTRAMSFSECLAPQSVTIDEWAEGTDFAIPFFLFQGEYDVITPPRSAQRFFDDVTAPIKKFALIEDASHFAALRRPDRFLDLLRTHVLPAITAHVTPSAPASSIN